MTYSIVAHDPADGAVGVAVQSCVFGVGAIVPWVRAGVGVVASQAISEPAYGPRCLDALAAGASAAEALERAKAADPASSLRQVGLAAADGSVAAFTGELCIDHAGHLTGAGFAVQANMMAGREVWPAMADAYTLTAGPLERRLLAALQAAQDNGGDARGQMSAAIMVVPAAPSGSEDGPVRLVDVRVDRHDDPIGELGSLLDAADAARFFRRAVTHLVSGDPDQALAEIDNGLALQPGDENLRFLRAGALLARANAHEGSAALRDLVAGRPTWEIVIRSFAAKGLMTIPPGVSLDTLLGSHGAARS